MHSIRTALVACAAFGALSAASARAQADCDVYALKASNPQASDKFGTAIAALGDTCVIATPLYGPVGLPTGAVHTFRRSDTGTWGEESVLAPPGLPGAKFGSALALDGTRLAVTGHSTLAETVWVFEKKLATWGLVETLTAPADASGAQFGAAIALSGDFLLIGAPGIDRGVFNSGAAYVYQRSAAGPWVKTQGLRASDPSAQAQFGAAVAMRGDVALIAAPGAFAGVSQAGAVYAYELKPQGWTEVQKLSATHPSSQDQFGASVALDGDVAAIGAPFDNAHGLSDSGSIHVYRRQPDSLWALAENMTALDRGPGDEFGRSVCLNKGWLAVGAPGKDYGWDDRGAVYLFREIGAAWKNWAPWLVEDSNIGDRLGDCVAIATAQVLAGAPKYNLGFTGVDAGAVFSREISDAELLSCPRLISVSSGGLQQLRLEAGTEHAIEWYLMLGSLSGTSPGLSVDGQHLPLNLDAYFLQTLGAPNQQPWLSSFGVTNGFGQASMRLLVPAGAYAALAGQTAHHAVVTWKLFAKGQLTTISNATELQFLP
jgi:hypothetical protein